MIPFGDRNIHCNTCGDERGGPVGHDSGECQYRRGMTAGELARTMSPEKASRYWNMLIDRYFEDQLGERPAPTAESAGGVS